MTTAPIDRLTALACDVRRGLGRPGQKELPPSHLYDELGSVLFEAITHLPEYGLTRADARLLKRHSSEIASRVSPNALVAELGSGTGTKTRHVLEALGRRQIVEYYPIDVSAGALRACTGELDAVASVNAIHAPYLDGLRRVTTLRPSGQSMLVLFLGSTIGNFDRAAALRFIQDVRALLLPGDAMLIGADLVKAIPRMLLAYDDPLGVTAAFNKNVLVRINRELSANFDPRKFVHEVRWNQLDRRIEMHLRSTCQQRIDIPGADLTLSVKEGETIWTESSHKFEHQELTAMADSAGFIEEVCWIDAEWPFAESLWRV